MDDLRALADGSAMPRVAGFADTQPDFMLGTVDLRPGHHGMRKFR
jgi:hypothetical protein